MQKKILSDQTLEELKRTEKKHISIVTLHIILFCILIGIAAYLFLEKGFSLYQFFPLLYIPIFIYGVINLRKVKDEIRVRSSHISLQKRMEEMK
jgi:hypothetical protein